MRFILIRIVLPTLTFTLLASCSNKQMYDSLQKRNEAECYKLPVAKQQECLQQARSISYKDYQRELEKSDY